jgi:hypothetical protein
MIGCAIDRDRSAIDLLPSSHGKGKSAEDKSVKD